MNDFEETTAVSEGDGHQALAFFLGLRNRPHLVRLAGGWPGNCLVGESLRESLVLVHLFLIYSSGSHFLHCVRFGLLAVWPQSVIFQSFW